MENAPLITNDAIVFGILMLCLGFVFYTEAKEPGFWNKFYKIVPGLLMCYLLPSIFSSFGIISPELTKTYFVSSRYLLPASLVFFFQAEDGIRDFHVTGVQTCALPI